MLEAKRNDDEERNEFNPKSHAKSFYMLKHERNEEKRAENYKY